MFKNRQIGAGVFSILVIVVAFCAVVMLSIKLIPMYLDDFAISKVLSSLNQQSNLKEASNKEFTKFLVRAFKLNTIRLSEEEFQVIGSGEKARVEVDYERRVHIFYNVDVLLTFDHEWEWGTEIK